MDVSLTMFGNGLLRNGSMIFVNADYGVGTAVADQLALGGIIGSINRLTLSALVF